MPLKLLETAAKVLTSPAERVDRARKTLADADGRTDLVRRAYEDAEGRLGDAMVEAATGGPDRIVEARKARDAAKATLDDHLALVSGLRSRVAQVEAEEADAIAKERAKQRDQVVRLLVAAGENLDQRVAAVGEAYRTFYDLRARLFDLSDAEDRTIYGSAPKKNVVEALIGMLFYRASGGRLGGKLPLQSHDEAMTRPAFRGLAVDAAYQLAAITVDQEPPQAA